MGADNKKIQYKVRKKDLKKCFEFSIKYHLKKGGGSYSRTTGQYRGLGGKVDSFFIGKLIEIGVASIISKFTKKEIFLDFDIHEETDEPDIVKVKEVGKERAPQLYTEIKNISTSDRWIGLTVGQFDAILKNKIVNGSAQKAFVVYASLFSKNNRLDNDLLGVYLKLKTGNGIFKKFCETKDLGVIIQYIVNAKELHDKGVEFKKGSYMYETEIFQPASDRTSSRIISLKHKDIYKLLATSGKTLPIIMRNEYPKPKEFGKFKYKGGLEIFVKYNKKSKRMYVYCKTDVLVKNKILGAFELERGKVYECFFTTLGRDPVLKRDNLWIAQRNLVNILSHDKEKRIKEIAERI